MEKTNNSIFERDENNNIVRTKVNYYNSIFNFLYEIKKIETFPKDSGDIKKYISDSEDFIMDNISIFGSLNEEDFKGKSILYEEDFKATKAYVFQLLFKKLPDDWEENNFYRRIFCKKYEHYNMVGYIFNYFIRYKNEALDHDSLLNEVVYSFKKNYYDLDIEDSAIINWAEEAINSAIDSGALIKEQSRYYLSEKFYNMFYSFMISFRFYDTCVPKTIGANAERIYNNYCETIVVDKQNHKCKDISNEQLLDYLNCIASINSNIISLKKRYSSLERKRSMCLSSGRLFPVYFDKYDELYSEKETLVEEIESLKNKISKKFEYAKKIFLDYPSEISKPTFTISAPKEPTMKKASLFNKKKIDEENKNALDEYNIQKKKYEEKHDEYLHKLEIYENELAEYKKEVEEIKAKEEKLNKEECLKEEKEYEKNIESCKKNLDEKNKKLEKFDENFQSRFNNLLLEDDTYKELKSIDYEMNYIKECLKENIIKEKELYSYNILYGKYNNYIAVCSFIDYFNSGRCEKLDGTAGAYNLFEQESRSNLIINKLDSVLNSLEEIKNNQFYIYNELKNISNSIDAINGQLLVNNILQTVQIGELSKIIDNTNEIAYNTSVTAYYSKMAANSAKAIAIMNVLDRL